MEILIFDPKEFDDPQAFDGLKVISNESMDFNDPKQFNDPQVFDDPKGSMDFDNPKVFGDTSILDGLVCEQSLQVAICDSQASKTNFRRGEQIAMIVIVNLKNLSDSARCPFEMGSQAFHAKSLWLQIMTIMTPTQMQCEMLDIVI